MFAAIHVNGIENGTKVVEAPVPDFKKWGRRDCGTGSTGATYGLPRFEKGEFTARFPFGAMSATGYGTVGLQNGRPFMEVREGAIDVQNWVVAGHPCTPKS